MSVAFWNISPFVEWSWQSQSPLSRDPTFRTMTPQSVGPNPKYPMRPSSWDAEESEKLKRESLTVFFRKKMILPSNYHFKGLFMNDVKQVGEGRKGYLILWQDVGRCNNRFSMTEGVGVNFWSKLCDHFGSRGDVQLGGPVLACAVVG